MLPASLPEYEDIETKLRKNAGPAWTVFFTYLIVIALGSGIAFAAWGDDDWEPAFLFLDFALLVTTLIFAARFWADLQPLLSRLGLFHPATWIGLALLAPLLALNFGYHSMLVEMMSIEKEDYMDYFSSKWGPLLFICIMPAVVEEIGFRGIIQTQLEKVVSPRVAILVASAAFSAAHFNPLSAPYLALVGVLLGWLKWKTGSLYPAIAAHFLHNYVVVTYF
jgi:membrane protease YdiL (CAAX protease family)